jgi:hypothetical protein
MKVACVSLVSARDSNGVKRYQTFGGGAFAHVHSGNVLVSSSRIALDGVPDSSSLRDLGAERRRNRVEVQVARAVVLNPSASAGVEQSSDADKPYHWHLSAFGGSVAFVTKTLVHESGQPKATPEEDTRFTVLACVTLSFATFLFHQDTAHRELWGFYET